MGIKFVVETILAAFVVAFLVANLFPQTREEVIALAATFVAIIFSEYRFSKVVGRKNG